MLLAQGACELAMITAFEVRQRALAVHSHCKSGGGVRTSK